MSNGTPSFTRQRILATFVVVLGLAGLVAWWLHTRHFETTDDAQVEGHLHAVGARVTGTVVRLNPELQNNHFVPAGTLLVELDPNDADAAVDQARAALAAREAAASAADADLPVVRANAIGRLAVARASETEAVNNVAVEEASLSAARHRVERDQIAADRAERDRQRYAALVEKHEISRSEYDVREAEARGAAASLEADRADVTAGEQRVAQARSRITQRQAEVDAATTAPEQISDAKARVRASAAQIAQARADLHAAELNAGYTRIYAPVGGIIGRKTVEVGHRVQPGQGLLVIVPTDDIWVTANFKETQLRQMHPGQAVRLHVDAFDWDYRGTIEELAGAAGTMFSLLPPENASGNFVKVVQRLPVRIRLDRGEDPDHRLRPGMSVDARVRVN